MDSNRECSGLCARVVPHQSSVTKTILKTQIAVQNLYVSSTSISVYSSNNATEHGSVDLYHSEERFHNAGSSIVIPAQITKGSAIHTTHWFAAFQLKLTFLVQNLWFLSQCWDKNERLKSRYVSKPSHLRKLTQGQRICNLSSLFKRVCPSFTTPKH